MLKFTLQWVKNIQNYNDLYELKYDVKHEMFCYFHLKHYCIHVKTVRVNYLLLRIVRKHT
jgi:hypothetical protein